MPVLLNEIQAKYYSHRRTLTNNIGEGEAIMTMEMKNFTLRSQFRKRGEVSLNQSFNVHAPPSSHSNLNFYLLHFKSVVKKTILRFKKYWRGICPPPT
jgi:hypothetical protein